MPIDDAFLTLDEEALEIERQQATDEGRALSSVEADLERLRERVNEDPIAHQDEARALLERVQDLPYRTAYPYEEPSDLEGIRAARPDGPRQLDLDLGEDELADRIAGAWLGRCSGCLLGKPVEGWSPDRLWGFLRDTDNYPMSGYIDSEMPDAVWDEYDWDDEEGEIAFVDDIDHMARDDDIDYTVVGLRVLERNGIGFESADVAEYWLRNVPALNTYTAERVAYRNFLELVDPPRSASRHNPYREGIGAQIRADAYGYVCAGNLELAAELASRDARISHVKNGIYGAMWVAAMLAAAPVFEDREAVVRTGLTEVPAESRLTEAVEDVLGWYHDGVPYDEAVDRIHERWDEGDFYGWLHVISNAQVVTVGLLWGEGDFEQSITRAVQAGFDTDCNGATVGSIVGMMRGASSLPDEWIDPLGDTVDTALVGSSTERISDLADRTLELHEKYA